MAPPTLGVLGQAQSMADTAIQLYKVPINRRAVASTLVVCNTGSETCTFRIHVGVAGAAPSASNAEVFDLQLAPGARYGFTEGMALGESDTLHVQASTDAVTFTVHGEETDAPMAGEGLDWSLPVREASVSGEKLLDPADGPIQIWTLTGDTQIKVSTTALVGLYSRPVTLLLVQDGVGGHIVTLPDENSSPAVTWGQEVTPTLGTTAGMMNPLYFVPIPQLGRWMGFVSSMGMRAVAAVV